MPHIISESGRALTAHHALLLINVIDVESQIEPVTPQLGRTPTRCWSSWEENLEALSADRVEEVFHDAVFAKERPRSTSPAACSRSGTRPTPSSSTWSR